MAHRRRAPARTTERGHRAPLVLLVAVVVAGGMPLRARAALVSDDFHTGNGRHNRNSVSVNSPSFDRGIQNITNTTAGGNSVAQAAFCKKKVRNCRISQRLKVSGG